MTLKKLIKFSTDNYFIPIFLACILFVGVVSVYKLFFTRPVFVYVKVKMGQGLWWASTAKPAIWFVEALKKDDVETSLTGSPIAQIQSIRYYPWYGTTNQYDIYLTLKLKVNGNPKTGKYNFKRSTIGVGSPIDLEFPSTQVSGTVTELNIAPFAEKYVNLFMLAERITSTLNGRYDFCMCNPPFYEDEQDIRDSLEGKAYGPSAVCQGTTNEMMTVGGEVLFVRKMIDESIRRQTRIR